MQTDELWSCGAAAVDGALRWQGRCLSEERACVLRGTLLRLQRENRWRGSALWGVVLGCQGTGDYWIAAGWRKDALAGLERYYSCDGGATWVLLPWPASERARALTVAAPHHFTGDPAAVTDVPCERDDPATQGLGGGGAAPAAARLKEEDRLAAVVHAVSEAAWCVPRGALCKTPDGCVTPSAAFAGLPADEAADLRSWLHARPPRNRPWNYNLLNRRDYNYAVDFLDVCDEDVPIGGAWSVQTCGGDTVVVRSLAWPGAVGYHRAGTPAYGWMYVGDGKPNLDLLHMLPNTGY